MNYQNSHNRRLISVSLLDLLKEARLGGFLSLGAGSFQGLGDEKIEKDRRHLSRHSKLTNDRSCINNY